MDNLYEILLISATGIVLLILLILYILTSIKMKKGIYLFSKISQILKRYAGIRRFKVLNNITIKQGDKEITIPHILIGFFGVLIINSVSAKGDVYGKVSDKNWIFYGDNNERIAKSNPIDYAGDCEQAIRKIFSTENIYKINIDTVSCIFLPKKKNLYCDKTDKIIKLNQLKTYLGKSKFEKDNNIEVEKLYDAIIKYKK